MPINTLFELAAMAAEGDPVLDAAETLLLIPDLLHLWLCGRADGRAHERDHDAVLRRARPARWATDLLERLGVPSRLLPEVVDPGRALGPLAGEVGAETGLGGATVVAVATHDTGSAVAAMPFRRARLRLRQRGTWSLVGVESAAPVISDAAFAANLTNEGGVGGTYRAAAQRHRAVAAARVPPRVGARRASIARSPSSSRWRRGGSGRCARWSTRTTPLFAAPGDMPARIADSARGTGQPRAGRARGAIVRCILESLALKHAESGRAARARHGPAPPTSSTSSAAGPQRAALRWTAAAAGGPVLAGPEEATLVGNLLVQAIALGELGGARGGARGRARRRSRSTAYEPRVDGRWSEARERFAALSEARRAEATA